jgi:hypothetical protein
LKLFLDKEDLEKVHDFEEECVEAYCVELDKRAEQSSSEQIRITWEKVLRMERQMDEIGDLEVAMGALLRNIDSRIVR